MMIRWISCWLGFVVIALPLLAKDQAQDAGALYLEARKLALGEGCLVDMNRARALYRKAADLGDPRALAWKARNIYGGGHGFSKDEAEARRIFQEIEPRLREMGSKKEDDALGSLCRTLGTIDPKTRGPEAFELAQKNAIDGKASDWMTLARCFHQGIGVTKNEEEALKWYRKSAEQGEATGQRLLGWYYANGTGVTKDEKEAVKWYRKSAEQGEATGQRLLGWCYANGTGVTKDEKEALRWYHEAADLGEVWSMGQLARIYEEGRGTEKNPAEAFRWWNRQVEKGDFWAPENVARCHANGIGTLKSPEEAAKWYGKVRTRLEEETKKNEAWAWDNLGRFYFNGLGAEKDYAKALECYRKAAGLKSGWAMEQMGWCLEKGFGVRADDKEALSWYLKAAEAGQAWSMGQCATFYENGRGTEKNSLEAYRWYLKKAETGSGDRWADENLGRCHEYAIGTKKDEREALRWYKKAADAGSLWAGEQVGRLYEEGIGTGKNVKLAYEYYLPAVKAQRPWAQYRMVSMGSSEIYDQNMDFADRCFEAAWDSGYRPAAECLYLLHTSWAGSWEGANPIKAIRIKREALRGQSSEGSESAKLAGELLLLGKPGDALAMVQELINSKTLGGDDWDQARWHALAGYCELADPKIDALEVQGKRSPERQIKAIKDLPAVGLIQFNFTLRHPQTDLHFQHSGDFVSPVSPRRWASYLLQHAAWGVRIWRDQKLRGFLGLASTATACYSNEGGVFRWADFPCKNQESALEHFRIADSLAPHFSARMGSAILLWRAGEKEEARLVLASVEKQLAEEVLAAENKEKSGKQSARRNKRGWPWEVEELGKNGRIPWGNQKGEVSFGFGFGSGGGFFHGELIQAIGKLVVPACIWLKPDWTLWMADLFTQSGMLSPMQMVDWYKNLADKEDTRAKASKRLAMIEVQLEDKEEAWKWAQEAVLHNPGDPDALRMASGIANWAGHLREAKEYQEQLYQAQARREIMARESPEIEYLRIFSQFHVAEALQAAGKTAEAKVQLQRILEDLRKLEVDYPEWESAVVRYRIRQLEKKLSSPDKKP